MDKKSWNPSVNVSWNRLESLIRGCDRYFPRRFFQVSLIILVLIFPTFFGSNGSWAAEKMKLTWGTTATTSGSFSYFVVAAKVLNDKIPEINISVRSTGGGVHNARLLAKKEVEYPIVMLKSEITYILQEKEIK